MRRDLRALPRIRIIFPRIRRRGPPPCTAIADRPVLFLEHSISPPDLQQGTNSGPSTCCLRPGRDRTEGVVLVISPWARGTASLLARSGELDGMSVSVIDSPRTTSLRLGRSRVYAQDSACVPFTRTSLLEVSARRRRQDPRIFSSTLCAFHARRSLDCRSRTRRARIGDSPRLPTSEAIRTLIAYGWPRQPGASSCWRRCWLREPAGDARVDVIDRRRLPLTSRLSKAARFQQTPGGPTTCSTGASILLSVTQIGSQSEA